MADEAQQNADGEEQPKKGSMLPFILLLVFSLIAGGSTPFLLASFTDNPDEETADADKEEEQKKKKKKAKKDDKPKEYAYIPFEAVTANLKSESLKRYINVKVSFKVVKDSLADVTQLVELHELVLKNWLIFYLKQHEIHDLNGASNYNRMRREIRENVNHLLFVDEEEQIEDVLFEEFNVQ